MAEPIRSAWPALARTAHISLTVPSTGEDTVSAIRHFTISTEEGWKYWLKRALT